MSYAVEKSDNFLGRFRSALCVLYPIHFWLSGFRGLGRYFSSWNNKILSWGLVWNPMIKKVFCRWIMGLHGATEFTGFSIPERRRSADFFLFGLFLFIWEGLGYEK
ncbi:hypothetical protein ES703_68113 [subsurface metagenome]